MGKRLLRLTLLTVGIVWVLAALALSSPQLGNWLRGAGREGPGQTEYMSALLATACFAAPGLLLVLAAVLVKLERTE